MHGRAQQAKPRGSPALNQLVAEPQATRHIVSERQDRKDSLRSVRNLASKFRAPANSYLRRRCTYGARMLKAAFQALECPRRGRNAACAL